MNLSKILLKKAPKQITPAPKSTQNYFSAKPRPFCFFASGEIKPASFFSHGEKRCGAPKRMCGKSHIPVFLWCTERNFDDKRCASPTFHHLIVTLVPLQHHRGTMKIAWKPMEFHSGNTVLPWRSCMKVKRKSLGSTMEVSSEPRKHNGSPMQVSI